MAVKTKQPVKLDHHHFGADPDDPQFNLNAARRAHADVMRRWDDPKEGDDFKALLLHAIQNATAVEIDIHRKEIQKLLDDFNAYHTGEVAKALIRSYVSLHHEVAKSLVSKAPYWATERRNAGGEWTKGITGEAQERGDAAAIAAHRALLAHVGTIASAMGANEAINYQIKNTKTGRVRTEVQSKNKVPHLKRNEVLYGRPRGEYQGADHDLTMGQHTFNLLQALGMRAGPSGATGRVTDAGMKFGNAWNDTTNVNYGNDTGAGFKRIRSGADALQTIAHGNPKAQVAVAVGKLVGDYGPEAEKVLGPHARKTAYKFRGVERIPRDVPRQGDYASDEDYHDALVGRIAGHIPSREVHDLNLASGYTAPSHGFVRDKTGKVVTEAHGYADDHYLPFKLSGLGKMKDGDYIRTRSTGGPTTEDIYTAAAAGAKKFTVTSRQGTYTVAFDPEFTHDKRFGDIALGMSKRYGKILDAVASGKVIKRGDLTDAQFQQIYQARYEQLRDDPSEVSRQRRAREYAEKEREAQQSDTGRKLHLDGEGYDYALQALASQYPYYIHYGEKRPGKGGAEVGFTGWSQPSDPKFNIDNDEGGGHLQRVGNAHEADTGYVKPRHIKSAHALVGYFDPTIGGQAVRAGTQPAHGKQVASDLNQSGKVRGDVAFYQNWHRNPYNPERVQPQETTGVKPSETTTTTTTSGQRTTPSSPYDPFADLVNKYDAKDAYDKLLVLRKSLIDNSVTMRQGTRDKILNLSKNPTIFAQYWKNNQAEIRNLVAEHGTSTLTNTPIGTTHADEQPDKNMDERNQRAQIATLTSYLDNAQPHETRKRLQAAATDLHAQDPQKYSDLDPVAGDWDHYHYAEDRKDVVRQAFPRDEFAEGEAGLAARKAKMDYAYDLMNKELELDRLQDAVGTTNPAERWRPRGTERPEVKATELERMAEPEPTDEEQGAMAAMDTEAEKTRRKVETGASESRKRYLQDVAEALKQASAQHVNNTKALKDDPVAHRRAGREMSTVADVIEHETLPGHQDAESFESGVYALRQMLKDNPQLGEYEVALPHPSKEGMEDHKLKDVINLYHEPRSQQDVERSRKQFEKRVLAAKIAVEKKMKDRKFTLSKRDTAYVIRRIA